MSRLAAPAKGRDRRRLGWAAVRRLVPVLAAATVLAAGCTADGDPVARPDPTTAAASTPAARTTAPRTTPPKASPAPTPPPVTVEAECPYADRDAMSGIVGQRLTRTTVVRTRPHVGCGYYRPDGERAVDIEVTVLAGASAARARAAAAAGRTSDPVRDVADGGSVAVVDDGTVLGVSEGAKLVVVKVNQRVPLEAVEIAKLVVANI